MKTSSEFKFHRNMEKWTHHNSGDKTIIGQSTTGGGKAFDADLKSK